MASLFDGFKSRNTIFSFKDSIPGLTSKAEFNIDVTNSFVTNLTGKATQYPTEAGGIVTDNFQANPMTVTITGFISESPSQAVLTLASNLASTVVGNQFEGLSSTFAAAATSAAVVYGAGFGEVDDWRTDATFNQLLAKRDVNPQEFPKRAMLGLIRLFNKGVLFSIRSYFDIRIYDNMIIESISFPHSANIGDSLKFTMTAKQIVTVDAYQRTKSEFRMKDPAGSSAAAKVDKGKVTPKKVPPAESSAIVKLGGGLGKLFGG